MAIVDNYSEEEFKRIVKESINFVDLLKKLGYTSDSSKTRDVVKKRIEEYQIDISHLKQRTNLTKRTEENVFVENSTANQATLRRWYLKGNYTSYKCSICGLEPIWQGKELTLILDHINGNNHDDRLENLRWVCPNCNQQLETTGFKKIRVITENKNYCIDCGKEIDSKSTRCITCFGKSTRIPLDKMPVTREELKGLIRTTPFTTIGVKYGVSDNAIRKWCDKFNLPRTAKEIKSYSNEEWDLI